MSDNYARRGVSASKDEVHKAVKHLDKGLYPNAFCKILPDITTGDKDACVLMHADTAGTKTSLAYLYWRETGDLSVWKGIAQDAMVMNLDDMMCVGCTDDIVLSSTIGRNKHLVSGDVIEALISGTAELIKELADQGVNIYSAGGETADVGDIVRTLDVGFTAFARMKRADVIENAVQPGDVIVGIGSFGQASYEKQYNSGIGSNGLTNGRHDVLAKVYAEKYPETYDSHIPDDLLYSGKYRVEEMLEGNPLSVGKMLLSPTRTYLPFMKQVLAKHKPAINGMIHCTGGGQTKCMKFVQNLHVIKDNLFDTPPVFSMIQDCSGASLSEMYEVFNMGHRLEIFTDQDTANAIISLAHSFDLPAQLIGRCETAPRNKLTIRTEDSELIYA